jgi:tetratricopeptide (TPR) repeat protein
MAELRTLRFPHEGLGMAAEAARTTLEHMEIAGGADRLRGIGFSPELPLILVRNLGVAGAGTDDAAAALRGIAERAPHPDTSWARPVALLHLGLLMAHTGKPDEALSAFEDALVADPLLHPAHFNLAILHAREHRIDEAKREMAAYAARAKALPVVAFGRAVIAGHEGNREEAMEGYRETIRLHEKAPVSPIVLGRLDVPPAWIDDAKKFVEAADAG